MPFILVVAGGSGSGKSHIAEKELAPQIEARGASVTVLSMDHYYKTAKDRALNPDPTNFDVPEALDMKLFWQHVAQLQRGEAIQQPVYCMKVSDRKAETVTVEPADVIIIEGIFAHHDLRYSGLDKSQVQAVFVDSGSYSLYLKRRLERDAVRNHTPDFTRRAEKQAVGPGFFTFIRPDAEDAARFGNGCIQVFNHYGLTDDDDSGLELQEGVNEVLTTLEAKHVIAPKSTVSNAL